MIGRNCFYSLVISVLVTGCGPTYTRTVMMDEGRLHTSSDGVSVGTISLSNPEVTASEGNSDNANRNNVTAEELYAAYREYLEEALVKSRIAYTEGQDEYVTNVTILGYKEGNAFLRWLTPAGGESKVVIQATIERDGKIIGGVESQQTIAWGGAFSIGGWRQVISWSAKELADEICTEMFDQNSPAINCKTAANERR